MSNPRRLCVTLEGYGYKRSFGYNHPNAEKIIIILTRRGYPNPERARFTTFSGLLILSVITNPPRVTNLLRVMSNPKRLCVTLKRYDYEHSLG